MAQMDECKKLSLGLNFEGIKDFFMDKFFFYENGFEKITQNC